MAMTGQGRRWSVLWLLLGACVLCGGCHLRRQAVRYDPGVPNEAARVPMPAYTIEPPDILLIEAVRLIPRPPYRIEPLDVLGIQVTDPGTKGPLLPNEPIAGLFTVTPEGYVDLGFSYLSVKLAGRTLEEARTAIEDHLKRRFKPPFQIVVELAQSKALQQIRGEHLVRPDGTVGLGTYGSVFVDGMTLAEARTAIEVHLAQYLLNPEISIDVVGYNSKVYYIITDGAGFGEQVYRLPVTGKETVLDAIAQINGLPPVASKSRIWLARPGLSEAGHEVQLAVDWKGITQHARTATNYQVMPGDRIYVNSAPLVKADTYLARFISPLERILGVALLARTTVRNFESTDNNGVGIIVP